MQERHGAGEVSWNSDRPIRGQMAELDYLSDVVSFALCNKQLFGYYDTGVLGDGSVILCTIAFACDIESAINRNLHILLSSLPCPGVERDLPNSKLGVKHTPMGKVWRK